MLDSIIGLGWTTLGWILVLINLAVAIVGAIFVYRDAENKPDLFLDLHAVWWAGSVLITSIVGILFYWLLHYSALAVPVDDTPTVDEGEDESESS